MKRYWLFAGDDFYPPGGFADFQGSFDALEEAITYSTNAEWHHVFDSQSHTIVDFNEGSYSGEMGDVQRRHPELGITYDEE